LDGISTPANVITILETDEGKLLEALFKQGQALSEKRKAAAENSEKALRPNWTI